MGRNKKHRHVQGIPEFTYFKPQGIPLRELQNIKLNVDGLEALRLVDAEGLTQEEAAARMNVSRPTLCRIVALARKTTAMALSQGLAIRIEGGNYHVVDPTESSCLTSSTHCEKRADEDK